MAEPDLGSILSSLSSEDMASLKAIAGNILGGSSPDEAASASTSKAMQADEVPQNALAALSGLNAEKLGLPDLSLLSGLAPVLSALGKHDDRSDFILALKPLLSENKQKKADEAAKLMRLMSLLPLLKDNGIF